MIMHWAPKASVVFVLVAMFIAAGYVVFAQGQDYELKKDMEEIILHQEDLRKELLAIKALLSAKQVPGPVPVNIKDMEFDIGNRPACGSNSAQLLLVEFTDYQCPYCGRHVRETLPKIAREYIDKGIIRYAVADQPL